MGVLGLVIGGIGAFKSENLHAELTPISIFFAIFLVLLTTLLIVFICIRESRKVHQYYESIFYLTHNSQLIKDFLRNYKKGNVAESELNRLHAKIANNVSNCFSLIKGTRCSVCIKTIVEDERLEFLARDSVSVNRYKDYDKTKISNCIDDNTGFKVFWDENTPYVRYYINNDLPDSWSRHEYTNPAFGTIGRPSFHKKFGIHKSINWDLPYKSTLICPIRHVSDDVNIDCHYLGFICVDASSRGIFNRKIDPELLYGFANQLYLLETQIIEINELNEEINYCLDEIEQIKQELQQCTN